jgi:hypothetical protein
MKAPTARAGPVPGTPGATAPTPLFVPKPVGEPYQKGAQRTEPDEQAARPSVILAAAERLMQPPANADFVPDTLIRAEPPAQSDSHEEFGVDRMVSGPSDYSLTMLLLDNNTGIV